MFTLDCQYYKKTFQYLYQLLEDIIKTGMDPNYEVIYNGKATGTKAIDLISI